jgi:ABC-type polysaccharide/polyol phosphate export permease
MSAVTLDTRPGEPAPFSVNRSPAQAARIAFGALLLRDLVVLRKTLREFIPRTILQPVLLTLTPLACYVSAALGLTFGTRFNPRTVPLLFGIIVIPLTFLGCVYYSWQALDPIKWLQILVLFNPLVYMSEGFRAALTNAPHMSLVAVYLVLIAFGVLFTWMGIGGFKKRVLS